MITPWAFVRSTMRPTAFHGAAWRARAGRSYFEGWYVKLVDATQEQRWAVIPGVFVGESGSSDHVSEAFVQVLDGSTGRSWYHPYPLGEFSADESVFDVRVGPNRFTTTGVTLDLPEETLSGSVQFTSPLDPWPVSAASPGVMGWYAWVPTMECYHGVVSFGHSLAGSVLHQGRSMSFAGGRGYLEKDWGQAFPAGYVWLHSNHLAADPTACLVASTALIPWRGKHFRGWIVGLKHGGQLYRWATYTQARTVVLDIDDDHVRWTLQGRDGRLELVAARTGGGLLHAPIRTEMHQRVEETLDASVQVRHTAPDGRVLLDTLGTTAALEVHGDLDRLLATAGR